MATVYLVEELDDVFGIFLLFKGQYFLCSIVLEGWCQGFAASWHNIDRRGLLKPWPQNVVYQNLSLSQNYVLLVVFV